MKIDNYNQKLEDAKTTGNVIYSNPSVICGFKMRLMVFLNGCAEAEGSHLSVFFQLMKGKYDDCMEWPFDRLVYINLINQNNKNTPLKMLLRDAQDRKSNPLPSFKKPVTDYNEGLGWRQLITHSKLRAGGYIKNDILYIRTEIV